jgi:hypothetical protein
VLLLQVRAMPSVLQRIGEMNLVFGSMMRLWEPAEFEHLETLVSPPRIAELRPIGEQLRDAAQSTIYLRRTACKRNTRCAHGTHREHVTWCIPEGNCATAGIPALDEFDEFWMNVNAELEAHEEVRLGR